MFSSDYSQPVQEKKPRTRRKKVNPEVTVKNIMSSIDVPDIEGSKLPAAKPRARKTGKAVGQSLADFNELTDKEAVLENPDMFIDSVYRIDNPYWLMFDDKISKVTTDIPLGLGRLAIEVFANACDNATRCYVDGINPGPIEFNVSGDVVSVKNYGLPIPVIWNPEVGMWVPEWVLTRMKTGSNFRKQRHGGGRNGMGSTLTGFFSLLSEVTVYDHINHKFYYQRWWDGLSGTTGPRIEDYNGLASSTEFKYQLDLAKFGYHERQYPPYAYNLFARICADGSLTCKVPVTFNGFPMKYFSIVDYARLYVKDIKNYVLHYKWEDGVEIRTEKDGSQSSVSGVEVPEVEMIILDTPGFGLHLGLCNSLLNVEGGIHVNSAVKYVSGVIKEMLGKKKDSSAEEKKSANRVTKNMITGNVTIIINVRLPNPIMSGQTKSFLRGFIVDEKTKELGKFSLDISPDVKKKILSWDLAKNMENFYKNHITELIKKCKKDSKKRIKGKNAEDCEYARSPSKQHLVMACLFEGESARSYARCIRSFILNGSKMLILISLGGKINNAIKTKDLSDLLINELFQEIVNVCGLTWGMDYSIPGNRGTLRCQKGFMLMTDSDYDGLHIKMLVLAFFYKYFPSILTEGLVFDWRTRIKSASRPGYDTVNFYNERQFTEWEASMTPEEFDKWTIKYYKGLGTSSETDAKFDAENPWVVRLYWDPNASSFMETTMSGGKSTKLTKEWLANYDPNKLPDPIVGGVQWVSSFINDEFITYCLYTLGRALPTFTDGLNDTKRKIIWYATKHKAWKTLTSCNDRTLMRLDTFTNFMMAESLYHHGDSSGVVAGMTRSIVGSGAVPFFQAEGQFGTRIEGGRDCASSRYPKLIPKAKWMRALFIESKDSILIRHKLEESKKIDPVHYYVPIPLTLVTGWHGIASSWSSTIPPYHPLTIIQILVDLINGIPIERMVEPMPFYRGFKGKLELVNKNAPVIDEEQTVSLLDDNMAVFQAEVVPLENESPTAYSLKTSGIMEMVNEKTLRITELPVGVWTKDYMEKVLDKMEKDGKISGYDTDNTIREVDITVELKLDYWKAKCAYPPTLQDFGLERKIGLTNMVFLEANHKTIKFPNVLSILKAFYELKIPHYREAKIEMLRLKQMELAPVEDDINYIRAVQQGLLKFDNNGCARDREDVIRDVNRLKLSEKSHMKLRPHHFDNTGLRDALEKAEKIRREIMEIQQMVPERMWLEDLERVWNVYISMYGDDRPRN
jgi:DNA topoisomerase-2